MARFMPRLAARRRNCAERYVFLVRAAAHAHWQVMRPNQGLPLRVLPLRRLPALSQFPGQSPSQLARCVAVGNCSMTMPISAAKLQAATRSIPGTVVQRATCHGQTRILPSEFFQTLV